MSDPDSVSSWVTPGESAKEATGDNYYDNNFVWEEGTAHQITWKTGEYDYYIQLFQQVPEGGGASVGPLLQNVTNDQNSTEYLHNLEWTVDVGGLDIGTFPVYYLGLFPSADPNKGYAISQYFNITEPSVSSSSSSSSSSTSSIYSSTPTFVPATVTVTDSTQETPAGAGSLGRPVKTGTPNSDGGLSTGAKAGIGAGVGILALVVIAIVAFLFWRRRSRKRQQTKADPNAGGAYAETSQTGGKPFNAAATDAGATGADTYGGGAYGGYYSSAERKGADGQGYQPVQQADPVELPATHGGGAHELPAQRHDRVHELP